MLIFWTNFGGGGAAQGGMLMQFLPLLIFLLPMITNVIFGGDGNGFATTYVYDSRLGWQRNAGSRSLGHQHPNRIREEPPTSYWAQSITLLAFTISMIIGYFAARQAWRRNQQAAANRGGGRQGPHRSHAERVAATAKLIQKLPIQVHHTKEELSSKSISQLKLLLKEETKQEEPDDKDNTATAAGASSRSKRTPSQFLEKEDLIEALLGGPAASRPHDSSAESCSICCEDYICGDLKRKLPLCGHQFHVECVDRWFLSSSDYSRPVACPMCNTELKEDG